jgi:hypothetical protein
MILLDRVVALGILNLGYRIQRKYENTVKLVPIKASAKLYPLNIDNL